MCGGERPIGTAKGTQSDTEALCQPPSPSPLDPLPPSPPPPCRMGGGHVDLRLRGALLRGSVCRAHRTPGAPWATAPAVVRVGGPALLRPSNVDAGEGGHRGPCDGRWRGGRPV